MAQTLRSSRVVTMRPSGASRTAARRQRVNRAAFRADVAQALLHLDDVPWLADSALIDLPLVQERCQSDPRLFAEGHALAAFLRETSQRVVDLLDGGGKLGLVRAALTGVCTGKSVACVAREVGKSREHFSRTYWVIAADLVAEELLASRPH